MYEKPLFDTLEKFKSNCLRFISKILYLLLIRKIFNFAKIFMNNHYWLYF